MSASAIIHNYKRYLNNEQLKNNIIGKHIINNVCYANYANDFVKPVNDTEQQHQHFLLTVRLFISSYAAIVDHSTQVIISLAAVRLSGFFTSHGRLPSSPPFVYL